MCRCPIGSSCSLTTIPSSLTLFLLTSGYRHMGAPFPNLHSTIRLLLPTYMGSLNSCQLTTLWIHIIPISGIAVLLVVSTQLSSSSDQKGWTCLYFIPPTRCIWSIRKKTTLLRLSREGSFLQAIKLRELLKELSESIEMDKEMFIN